MATMAVIVVAVGALGAPFGLLWAMVAPDVPLRMTERGPAFAEAQPQQLVAADVWFVLLGLLLGVLAAVGVWLAAPQARGAATLVALTVGAVGAGLLAWWLGRQVGLTDYRATLAAAEVGNLLDQPPDLRVAEVGWWPPRVAGVLLVPALAAAVTYTLMAAWSKFPTLRPDAPALRDPRVLTR